MRMPDDSLRLDPFSMPWSATARVRFERVTALRDPSPGKTEFRTGREYSSNGRFAAMGAITWKPLERGAERVDDERVGVWDLTTGKAMGFVRPPRSLPEEVTSEPESVAVSDDGRTLVTSRDEVLHVWNVSDGALLQTISFGKTPIILNQTWWNDHWAYTTRTAQKPRHAIIDSTRGTLAGEVGYPVRRITWDLNTGAELANEAVPEPTRDPACGDVTLGSVEYGTWYLESSSGRHVLFEHWEYLSNSPQPLYFDNCRFMASEFGPRPRMLSPGDDTPEHVRIWSTSTGKVDCWFRDALIGQSPDRYGSSLWILAFQGPNRDSVALFMVDMSRKEVLGRWDGATQLEMAGSSGLVVTNSHTPEVYRMIRFKPEGGIE
jgi:WD40 repeat protein